MCKKKQEEDKYPILTLRDLLRKASNGYISVECFRDIIIPISQNYTYDCNLLESENLEDILTSMSMTISPDRMMEAHEFLAEKCRVSIYLNLREKCPTCERDFETKVGFTAKYI